MSSVDVWSSHRYSLVVDVSSSQTTDSYICAIKMFNVRNFFNSLPTAWNQTYKTFHTQGQSVVMWPHAHAWVFNHKSGRNNTFSNLWKNSIFNIPRPVSKRLNVRAIHATQTASRRVDLFRLLWKSKIAGSDQVLHMHKSFVMNACYKIHVISADI